MKILVTGGAGYIGSFMTRRLMDEGYEVVVVDSLERGIKAVVDKKADFMQGDLRDESFLTQVFSKHKFEGIIHFAGYISMGESMKKPGIYFDNNVTSSVLLLDKAVEHRVESFIFSSTAGVYGNPTQIPIPENHPQKPTNPYGESKKMVETILQWYSKLHGISFISLRYFNTAGASLNGSMGEQHDPETHLIPNAIRAVLTNQQFTLFGDDYNTTDGTCIRDYIHVVDLIEAHMLSFKKLQNEKGAFFYNVGTGKGYTNKEVLLMIKKVSGVDFPVVMGERRAGDAETLIADPTRINSELKFSPQNSDLETIVKTAWKWHNKNSKFKIPFGPSSGRGQNSK